MTAVAFRTKPAFDAEFVDIPLPDDMPPPLYVVDDKGRVWGADGYERGGCQHCLHRSMRMYGGLLANHPRFSVRPRWLRFRSSEPGCPYMWRGVWVLVPTTGRCPGSGEPPRMRRAAGS